MSWPRGGQMGAALRLQHRCGRGRMAGRRRGGADRTDDEIAAAIGADPAHRRAAIAAERAFEGADARLFALGRQVTVAAFSIGSEREHETSQIDIRGCYHDGGAQACLIFGLAHISVSPVAAPGAALLIVVRLHHRNVRRAYRHRQFCITLSLFAACEAWHASSHRRVGIRERARQEEQKRWRKR